MSIDAIAMPQGLQMPTARKADGLLARDFEAMLLAPMVEAMLPDAGAVFGEGPGSDVWRAQLATSIAAAMAERGVLGLGESVLSSLGDPQSERKP